MSMSNQYMQTQIEILLVHQIKTPRDQLFSHRLAVYCDPEHLFVYLLGMQILLTSAYLTPLKKLCLGLILCFWLPAFEEELSAQNNNKTWSFVQQPKEAKPLNSIWVFKVIKDEEGNVKRFKARLCAEGCEQKHGIDYTETFAPVVRYDSIRVLLAWVAMHDLEIKTFDVCTAFLYGELDHTIYMKVPTGVEIPNSVKNKFKNIESVVLLLIKSIYGLKQAPRCWNSKFVMFLKRFNFVANQADKCVFISKVLGFIVMLAIFVDDGMVICVSLDEILELLTCLESEFDNGE